MCQRMLAGFIHPIRCSLKTPLLAIGIGSKATDPLFGEKKNQTIKSNGQAASVT